MGLMFKDDLFDAQWMRAAGHAAYGGAEIGECIAAARAIREPDPESWRLAWTAMAERVAVEADRSAAAGRAVSACGAYLRAANYFRAAYTFLIGPDENPHVAQAYRGHRAAFAAAAALMQPAGEAIAIPYESSFLHGYLFRAAATRGERRPLLIVNGGYDSTAEEGFLFAGAAALARGWHCLTFDGPGQGQAIIEQGLTFRPDWEAVIRPVVDFALARAEVDPACIALMGVSFGGCLAPRAAAAEPRLAALICDPGQRSLFEEMQTRLPPLVGRAVAKGDGWAMRLLDRVLRRRMAHPTRGWALRRGLWTHGLAGPLDYLRATADYGAGAHAASIGCATLVCAAEGDEIGATAAALYDTLTCRKSFLRFTAAEGAAGHCEAGARTLFNQRALDWLAAVLETPAATSTAARPTPAPRAGCVPARAGRRGGRRGTR